MKKRDSQEKRKDLRDLEKSQRIAVINDFYKKAGRELVKSKDKNRG